MPAPDNRTAVNYFSIGIELIGDKTSGFTSAQYQTLSKLAANIMTRLPIRYITGHSDIAPGRKTDPWNFDWSKFEATLKSDTTHPFTVLRH